MYVPVCGHSVSTIFTIQVYWNVGTRISVIRQMDSSSEDGESLSGDGMQESHMQVNEGYVHASAERMRTGNAETLGPAMTRALTNHAQRRSRMSPAQRVCLSGCQTVRLPVRLSSR